MMYEFIAQISFSRRKGLISSNYLAVRSLLTTSILLMVIFDNFMPFAFSKRRLKAYHFRQLLLEFCKKTVAMFSLAKFYALKYALSTRFLRMYAYFSERKPSMAILCLAKPHTFLKFQAIIQRSCLRCPQNSDQEDETVTVRLLLAICLSCWKGKRSCVLTNDRKSSYMTSSGSQWSAKLPDRSFWVRKRRQSCSLGV